MTLALEAASFDHFETILVIGGIITPIYGLLNLYITKGGYYATTTKSYRSS